MKDHPNEKAEEETEAQRKKRIVERMDDNDTHAFFEAEELLTEAQQQPARNIAGGFRVRLADRREQIAKLQGE
jgi:hypothetical protein